MKNTLSLIATGVTGLVIGLFVGRFSSNYTISFTPNQTNVPAVSEQEYKINDQTSKIKPPTTNKPSLISQGKDQYEIRWYGQKGAKLSGSYSIIYPYELNKLDRREKIDAILPHTLKFSEVKGVFVGAGGTAVSSDWKFEEADVKIYRNGVECGTANATGSAASKRRFCHASRVR